MAFAQPAVVGQIVGAGPFGRQIIAVFSLGSFLILVQLNNVDNTHDLDKPISNQTAAALMDLQGQVDDSASQASLDALTTVVDTKASQDSVDALTIIVDDKADTSTVDALTTRVAALETPKAYSTAMRPAATSFLPGTEIYDTDLTIPLWSDGINWKDSGGTIQ